MPKIIVETDPRFAQQLRSLLSQLGIVERYKMLQAVKSAVRQYRPLPGYWCKEEGGEYKCAMRFGDAAVTLGCVCKPLIEAR